MLVVYVLNKTWAMLARQEIDCHLVGFHVGRLLFDFACSVCLLPCWFIHALLSLPCWLREPGGNLFLLLAAVRHEVSDPRVVVCLVTFHVGRGEGGWGSCDWPRVACA